MLSTSHAKTYATLMRLPRELTVFSFLSLLLLLFVYPVLKITSRKRNSFRQLNIKGEEEEEKRRRKKRRERTGGEKGRRKEGGEKGRRKEGEEKSRR
jgi:hypothetical protein